MLQSIYHQRSEIDIIRADTRLKRKLKDSKLKKDR